MGEADPRGETAEDLIDRMRSGDEQAFALLFDRHVRHVDH